MFRPLTVLGAVFFMGMGLATGTPSAQRAPAAVDAGAERAANRRLAGTWTLVGEETGDSGAPAGNRVGFLIYDPAGYVGATIVRPPQPRFAGPQPTPQEARTALDTYDAAWGTFTVDVARGVVTHRLLGGLPVPGGTIEERAFTLSGNRLRLWSPSSARSGRRQSTTWERVPDAPNLTPTQRKLIGSWTLAAFERRNATTGALLEPNTGWTGLISYTPSGHVMVHMMPPRSAPIAGSAQTPEDVLATYRSYTGYIGPYTVNEAEQYVVHHIEATLNSGPIGTDYQRFLTFEGKRVALKPPPTKDALGNLIQTFLIWERVSD